MWECLRLTYYPLVYGDILASVAVFNNGEMVACVNLGINYMRYVQCSQCIESACVSFSYPCRPEYGLEAVSGLTTLVAQPLWV